MITIIIKPRVGIGYIRVDNTNIFAIYGNESQITDGLIQWLAAQNLNTIYC